MAVAVLPEAVADQLVAEVLAEPVRTTRGACQVIIDVLTDVAVVVTLLQGPDTVRRAAQQLSGWRQRLRRTLDSPTATPDTESGSGEASEQPNTVDERTIIGRIGLVETRDQDGDVDTLIELITIAMDAADDPDA